ncbi:MAG: molybdopterin-dependent oxidoreductase [Hyphomicrobiales bacterium]|nr:molybdopterin-dependent oxidoreductase [Hyphomicrobiales bacterium]
MQETDTLIKTTCPRDCYDACGMSVRVRDGVIQNVMGDRDHHVSLGKLCGKCAIAYNGVFRDAKARLSAPLRRTGKKGAGQFEPVSWDAALADIAARLKKISDSRTVYHTHYTGTLSMIAGGFPGRFFSRLGATEVDPDTVCNKAGHVVLADMFGTSLSGFDPEQIANARCLMVWGANPSHSAPHMHKGWVKSKDAALIVVDPIATGTAKLADIHLQLRPGSDAALAFGMLHAIKKADLLDRDFIDRHVLGFDGVEAEIVAATPQRTAALTGVDAALIEKAALAFARGPSLLWLGQGGQRQPKGGNVFRALPLLNIATGQLGKPGTGFCYMNGTETRGVDAGFIAGSPAASVSHMDLAADLNDPKKVRALFTWNNNIVASSPGTKAIRKGLAREDLFTVVTDIFMTDTAVYADYVLPAASFLEFDDIIFPYFHDTVSAQAKAAEPFGQSLPNQEIFRRLAKAMGFNEPELFESDASMIGRLLAQTSFDGDFGDLKKQGTARLFPVPRVQFEGLAFATPSGRIEVRSDRLVEQGLPPVPVAHADEVPEEGRLRLLTPAGEWLMNSSYCNDPKIAAQLGPAKVHLNAKDVARRNLAQGEVVRLSTKAGAIELTVNISADVPEGVALAHKSRWPSLSKGESNINILNPGLRTDIADSTAVHGLEVELVKLAG